MIKRINDLNIYYEIKGKGKNLIMLHGNGEDHNIFNKISDRLKEEYKIYLIDSRNHGKSDNTDNINYSLMADDIYKFIKMEELEEVSILGFSDGAIIALLSEISHPGLYKNMVLCGLNLNPDDFLEEVYKEIEDEYEKNSDQLMNLMLKGPYITNEDLKKVKARLMFIYGEYDVFKNSLISRIRDIFINSYIYILDNENHDSYIINNDKIYGIINTFLDNKFE